MSSMNQKRPATCSYNLFVIIVFLGLSMSSAEEYCLLETFRPSCNESQSILMLNAKYGRMQTGRCLGSGTDPTTLDCSTDVLPYIDRKCSGRNSCELRVFDLESMSKCASDLKSYLDAEYMCVGTTSDSESGDSGIIEGVNGTCLYDKISAGSGFIPGNHYLDLSRGTESCPWRIEASPGQHVVFNLLDFTLTSVVSQVHQFGEPGCPAMFIVEEPDREPEVVSLCVGSIRQRYLYTSKRNDVTFYLLINETLPSEPSFFIKYEVHGCPDMDIPKEAWSNRQGESLTISCNNTGETWYLVCKGTEWLGDPANCTQDTSGQKGGSGDDDDDDGFPFGILIAVCIGIGVGVVAGLSLLGLAIGCRKCYSRVKKGNSQQRSTGNALHDLSKIEVPYKDPPGGATPPPTDQRIYTTASHSQSQPGPYRGANPRDLHSGPYPSTSAMSTMEHPGYHHSYPRSTNPGQPIQQGAPVTVHTQDRAQMPLPPQANYRQQGPQNEPIYDTAATDYDTLKKLKEGNEQRTLSKQ